jgi:hypothetical protein
VLYHYVVSCTDIPCSVLVYFTGRVNSGKVFLTVLESAKSKIKGTVNLVAGDAILLHPEERKTVSSKDTDRRDKSAINPSMLPSSFLVCVFLVVLGIHFLRKHSTT